MLTDNPNLANPYLGQIGDGSFDVMSGSIMPMFEFGQPAAAPLFLDPSTGEPLP